MCDIGQVKAAGMPLQVSGLTRTDVAGLREAPLFQEPIAFRSLIQLVATDSEAFPRRLALAVENRLVLHSALDILFKAGQYVFAIHSRPRNRELRTASRKCFTRATSMDSRKYIGMTCIKQA